MNSQPLIAVVQFATRYTANFKETMMKIRHA